MMKIILDMTYDQPIYYMQGGRNRPNAKLRESKMRLRWDEIRRVLELKEQQGKDDGGYERSLELWRAEIARTERARQLELLPSVGWGTKEMTQSEIDRQLDS